MKHIAKLKRILFIIIVITVCVIWGHSAMPPDLSSEESWAVLTMLNSCLSFVQRLFGIGAGNELQLSEFIVRKLAHFTEYFCLGAELSLMILLKRAEAEIKKDDDSKKENEYAEHRVHNTKLYHAVVIAAVVASVDETIQFFSGRTSMLRDVLLDVSGAVCACLLISIFFSFRKAKKEKIFLCDANKY